MAWLIEPQWNGSRSMLKALRGFACGASVAFGLVGCMGTAGVATWQYQSGPSGGVERVHEAQVLADTEQGLETAACTTTIRRQAGPIGRGSMTEVKGCHS